MQGTGGATAEPRKGRNLSIRPGGWARLAVATLAVLAAAALRWAARSELGSAVPFIFFYPALIVATWFGRRAAGIFALALSAFLSIGFLDPLGRFGVADAVGVFALASYLLVGGFVVGAVDLLHKSRRRREGLAAIVESSDDAIISVDVEGKILTWNPGARRLFGFEESKAVGHPIGMLLPPGREDDFDRALSAVGQGERVEHYESVRRRKDGSLVDVSPAVAPIRDARGTIVGVSKVARDVTSQRAREREQARTRELFLEMLGHDLRAPLNGISFRVVAEEALLALARGRPWASERR